MPNSAESRGRVVVAGATGYLGKYAVRTFKRRGYWVRALTRMPTNAHHPALKSTSAAR